jgi:hypothetical protein
MVGFGRDLTQYEGEGVDNGKSVPLPIRQVYTGKGDKQCPSLLYQMGDHFLFFHTPLVFFLFKENSDFLKIHRKSEFSLCTPSFSITPMVRCRPLMIEVRIQKE